MEHVLKKYFNEKLGILATKEDVMDKFIVDIHSLVVRWRKIDTKRWGQTPEGGKHKNNV